MRIETLAIIHRFKPNHTYDFFMFYAALILLSFHWAVVTYINSSFLEQFVSPTIVSVLFVIASVLLLLVFFWAPHILRKTGNFAFTVGCTFAEIIALVGMAFAHSLLLAVLFFLLHFVSVPLILFGLDVFIEHMIGSHETQTGSKRGLYLSLSGLAGAVAPLFLGLISINNGAYGYVYITGTIFLFPFLLILFTYFKSFEDPLYETLSVSKLASIFLKQRDIRNIVIVSVYLQTFFSLTYIFVPLYLAKFVGFSWYEIGLIMFVGLSAYVIFEYPIGVIADRYIGEKEMMAVGFLVIALSVGWFSFLQHADISIWMLAMFLTRTGASLVESTSESYFFKKAGSIDTHKISLFRMTRSVGSVFSAAIGSVVLVLLPYYALFIVFGIVLVQGFYFTLLLKDTK